MALNADSLASLVFANHLSVFPDAVKSVRGNPEAGVATHSPVERLIHGLATGLVDALSLVRWVGTIEGTDDGEGTPQSVVQVSMPGIPIAVSTFLIDTGWNGEYAGDVAQVFIQYMLENVQFASVFQGDPSPDVGTGTATFNSVTSPGLQAQVQSALYSKISAALLAEGVFHKDDVEGNPLNAVLAEQVTHYAKAYAVGLSSISVTLSYEGDGGSSNDASGQVTGGLI